ncbi:hypothetical protein BFL35_06975 [Clavibacter michiganensis]|nr:hypothetical protein BFL35_06975 [Clavibacter michiganensis]
MRPIRARSGSRPAERAESSPDASASTSGATTTSAVRPTAAATAAPARATGCTLARDPSSQNSTDRAASGESLENTRKLVAALRA